MTPEQLKDHRLRLGLSITAMARALNTPRGTYIKWERGESRMPGIADVAVKHMRELNETDQHTV